MAKMQRTTEEQLRRVRVNTITLFIVLPVTVFGYGAYRTLVQDETVDATVIQAFASIVGLMLTVALVGATITYVIVTQDLARQAQRSNEQAAESARLAVQMAAPVLTLVEGVADWPDEEAEPFNVVFVVRNSGEGVATDIQMFSEWPFPLRLGQAVGSRDGGVHMYVEVIEPPEGFDGPPTPTAWEFTDLSGTHYRQPVGGRPVPV